MKLYKDYIKEPYLSLMNDPLIFRKKLIDNKIKQDKAQYDFDRKIAKIFTLSSGRISKYDILTEKDLSKIAATI